MSGLDWIYGGLVHLWHALYTATAIPAWNIGIHTMAQSELFALSVACLLPTATVVLIGLDRRREDSHLAINDPWTTAAASCTFGGIVAALACASTASILWFGYLAQSGPPDVYGVAQSVQKVYLLALLTLVVRNLLIVCAAITLFILVHGIYTGAGYRKITFRRRADITGYLAGAALIVGLAILI
jgi:hypothetical protein